MRTNSPYGSGTPFALRCSRSCESLPDFLTSDALADSRVQKPKNFLAFSSRLLPPPLHREAEKEMERKFLVLLRRFSLRKEHYYFITFDCSFLRPHGDRGAYNSVRAKAQANLYVLSPPVPCAHKSPPFWEIL